MQKPEYSYLDLSVLPPLRGEVLSPEPALVFDANIEVVLWVNAAGAEFFGGDGVAEMLLSRPSPSQPFIQQLRYACEQLKDGEALSRGFRVVRGLRSELIQCELTTIHLPQGEPAVLLQCRDEKLVRTRNENEIANMAVNSLEGFADAAAIIDDYTLTIASTRSFSDIDLSMEDMKILVDDLRGETDRLVKRPITALDSRKFAAGIARLSDNPGRNLLVLAGTGSQEIMEEAREEETKPASLAQIDIFDDGDNDDGDPDQVEYEDHEEYKSENVEADDILLEDEAPEEPLEAVLEEKNETPASVDDVEAETESFYEAPDDDTVQLSEAEEDGENLSEGSLDDDNDENYTFGIITKTASAEPIAPAEVIDEVETLPEVAKDIIEDELPPVEDRQEEKEQDFSFDETASSVRFAWTIDESKVFQSVSPELAEAVGPNASDVVGRNWSDVAAVFGFDGNGVIDGLLSRQDTWSGKSVLWPIQGSDLQVPVDLAALPAFGAGRQFEGFRGFGVIRSADAVLDPDATGLALSAGKFDQPQQEDAQDTVDPLETDEDDVSIHQILEPEDDFGVEDTSSNVVQLTPGIQPTGNDSLNPQENMAFTKIGETLRKTSDSEWVIGKEKGGDEELLREQENIEIADPVEPSPPAPIEDEPEPKNELSTDQDVEKIEQFNVPVLVYQNEACLFANDQLLELTGYETHDDLSAAGGIDALLESNLEEENDDEGGLTHLVKSDGTKLQGQITLRSIPWKDDRALMLTFYEKSDVEEEQTGEEKSTVEFTEISQLQNILTTATDGIIVVDKAGLIESINPPAEALFGIEHSTVSHESIDILFAVESHDAIDKTIAALTKEPDEDALQDLVGSVLNDGLELVGREAKGGLIPLLVTFGKIGSSDKICAIIRDMSSWKKAEEDLVQARRQAEIASEHKSDFLARVSHEIRTPLNAIIGFSDVMIEERFGAIDNERYREYLRDINRSGVHVLDLINDLLDLSKIESGKIELSFEAVELNKIVSETVALMQPQANSRRIIIRTSLSRAVPKVVADARAMRQIIMNLVSNAIKFSQRNGQVIVSTVYESNGEVALRIRDTGIGMSESELKDAMQPFHQVPGVSDRRGEGTGLGLPLTKALVDANKAHFDLESASGKGTIAHVQFPTQRVLAD